MNSHELAKTAAALALTKKAAEVTILTLKDVSDITDYFVVCCGDSDTHVKAIADAVDDGLREIGVRVWKKEGYRNLQWVLLDLVDVVVHIFQPKVREYYGLERLWGDAPAEEIEDRPGGVSQHHSPSHPL